MPTARACLPGGRPARIPEELHEDLSVPLNCELNGVPRQVGADPASPLLYALRNELDCKGARFGCGVGNCGACTVIVDGRALQSCTTPVWAIESRVITTAEGLAADPIGRVVQQAFLLEQAAQCGYCINGMLLSITALLHRTPQPDASEIIETLNHHLCRCGTHVRILRAVRRAIGMLADASPA
jgi:aerobic-type carbon monoxide dehydrogenase small subunit (CoxS/CutS family)